MDLEVKQYIDRLQIELKQLLRWRQEILAQIDIDRQLPGWQVADKYHQITTSLNKTIDGLKEEVRELKKGRKSIQDLDVFGKRLADELRRLLSWRRDIMTETADEQQKLEDTAEKRLEILLDINRQLTDSRLSLDEIKTAKEDFVALLVAKEKNLKLKENELAGRDKELTGWDAELKKQETKISEVVDGLTKEKSQIDKSKKSLDLDRQEIERQIIKVNSERVVGQKLNQMRVSKLKKLDEKLTEFDRQYKTLLLKEEALSKQTDIISEQFNQADKDRRQLTNQQANLKRAIFLARLRGVKI